eukprot:1146636-Pelagomonas_calceolata.AAC.6
MLAFLILDGVQNVQIKILRLRRAGMAQILQLVVVGKIHRAMKPLHFTHQITMQRQINPVGAAVAEQETDMHAGQLLMWMHLLLVGAEILMGRHDDL